MPQRIGNRALRQRHFIREWRKARGLTQDQLAERIGLQSGRENINKSSISTLETYPGGTGYTQESLEAIAWALGTTPALLLSRPPTEAEIHELSAPPPRQKKKRPNPRNPQSALRSDCH